jgi:hypothetical protein
MGWQARTSKDMIEPGGSREFAFEFPRTEGFQCADANTTVRFAAVYPPIEVPPTTLSMMLSNLQSAGNGQFEGDVSLRNLGPNDAVLNLGVSLGNGARSYPDKLSLVARGPDGALHKLHFAGMGAVAGRLDPMVVPLPMGSSYTVHGRWWASGVTAGKYAFFVEFQGTPARNANLDMPGMNVMKCWLGKLNSNEITLTVP